MKHRQECVLAAPLFSAMACMQVQTQQRREQNSMREIQWSRLLTDSRSHRNLACFAGISKQCSVREYLWAVAHTALVTGLWMEEYRQNDKMSSFFFYLRTIIHNGSFTHLPPQFNIYYHTSCIFSRNRFSMYIFSQNFPLIIHYSFTDGTLIQELLPPVNFWLPKQVSN